MSRRALSETLDPRAVDRVLGLRLGRLWPLPVLTVVLLGILLVPAEVPSAWVWSAVGSVSIGCYAWAWYQRELGRRLVLRLNAHAADLGDDGVLCDGEQLRADTVLRQYSVQVGFVLFELTLRTAPRSSPSATLPNLFTALLGWWAIPWGPINTLLVLRANASGGDAVTVAGLLQAVAAPEPPRRPWWRVGPGRPLTRAERVAVALVLAFVALAILAALLCQPRPPG